jgi:hypothetical protein
VCKEALIVQRRCSMLDPQKFAKGVLATMTPEERVVRVRELETCANTMLNGAATLAEFQERLYHLIEEELVDRLGHWLGRWEYDCEVEYWGGQSYMDSSIPDELLLRSEYPHGVRLSWGEYEFEPWPADDA